MLKPSAIAAVTVALFSSSVLAQPMNQEQMAATIQALQARVEALEARSRRDRSDADAARAELRAVKGAARRVVREPAPVVYVSTPAALVPAPVPGYVSGFDGLYGAVIGGYQFGTTKPVPDFSFSYPDVRATSGGNVGAALGYNATSGSLLISGEARFRKMFDEQKVVTYSPFFVNSQEVFVERFTRNYGGDLTMRAGFIWSDNLFYARVGGGADELQHVFRDRVSAGGPLVVVNKQETTVSPYTLIGIGVERNFGPWFARIEGAFLDHFEIRPNSYGRDSYFTTEISSAIGYRF